MRLTVDIDNDLSGEKTETAVSRIVGITGIDQRSIEVRQSSSGKGWHIRAEVPDKWDELELRSAVGDCHGRLVADSVRRGAGMRIGRLFPIKVNATFCGNIIKMTVKRAGEWVPYHEWLMAKNERKLCLMEGE